MRIEGYSPLSVANQIVKRSLASGSPITPMALQKLLYFTHGFFLAMSGKPAITPGFEAWPYGPVNRQVYEAYSKYGGRNIEDVVRAVGFVRYTDLDEIPNSEDLLRLADWVWGQYGGVNALKLSAHTHRPGSAWFNFTGGSAENTNKGVIPDEMIANEFSDWLAQSSAKS